MPAPSSGSVLGEGVSAPGGRVPAPGGSALGKGVPAPGGTCSQGVPALRGSAPGEGVPAPGESALGEGVPAPGGGSGPGGCLVQTPNSYCYEWYASYWNVFLLRTM